MQLAINQVTLPPGPKQYYNDYQYDHSERPNQLANPFPEMTCGAPGIRM